MEQTGIAGPNDSGHFRPAPEPGFAAAGRRRLLAGVGLAAVVLVTLCWCYWPTVSSLGREWQSDDNYSVGALVPLAALWLVWNRRQALAQCAIAPSGWGVLLILIAQAVRIFGLLFLYDSVERYSLVLTAAGLVLLILGRQWFRRLRWILAFLLLMVPFPGQIHNAINGPLQTLATSGAVFFLELLGVGITRTGNVLTLTGGKELAVAEACSGLRMLMAFIVVAGVLAGLVNRPTWQKATLVLSSIPIAIVCNLIRLVITAQLFLLTSSDIAETFFHDFAGLTMMPLAVLILAGELILLNKIVLTSPSPSA